jgi:hypothetical protein
VARRTPLASIPDFVVILKKEKAAGRKDIRRPSRFQIGGIAA